MSYFDTFKKRLNEDVINEFQNLQMFGPYVFTDDISDDELKLIYKSAKSAIADWREGYFYPRMDYINARRTAEKRLKERGVENLDEMSTSAAVPGYQTPNAFGKASDDTVEQLGFKKVKKKAVDESIFMTLSREMYLNEISYSDYKKDPIASPKQKINQSIQFIHKGLREIEKAVNHNVRLKQESNITNGNYWKSSRENLIKISERLIRVSQQLKELAS